MKKVIFKFSILLIALMLIFATFSFVNATGFIPTDIKPNLPDGNTGVQTSAAKIIGSLMWVGFAIGIGMIIYIGIKYIIASADERASMKGMLVKVVIGGIIIAASTSIVNAVMNLAS